MSHKMEAGRRPPFWEFNLMAITRSLLHIFIQNMWQRLKRTYQNQKYRQISLMRISKMAAGRHIDIWFNGYNIRSEFGLGLNITPMGNSYTNTWGQVVRIKWTFGFMPWSLLMYICYRCYVICCPQKSECIYMSYSAVAAPFLVIRSQLNLRLFTYSPSRCMCAWFLVTSFLEL